MSLIEKLQESSNDSVLSEMEDLRVMLKLMRAENEQLRQAIEATGKQEPVAWKFKFNNGTVCTVYTATEATDIRKHLDANEHETELYTRSKS